MKSIILPLILFVLILRRFMRLLTITHNYAGKNNENGETDETDDVDENVIDTQNVAL